MDLIKIFDEPDDSYLFWSFDNHDFVEVVALNAGRLGEGTTNSLPS